MVKNFPSGRTVFIGAITTTFFTAARQLQIHTGFPFNSRRPAGAVYGQEGRKSRLPAILFSTGLDISS